MVTPRRMATRQTPRAPCKGHSELVGLAILSDFSIRRLKDPELHSRSIRRRVGTRNAACPAPRADKIACIGHLFGDADVAGYPQSPKTICGARATRLSGGVLTLPPLSTNPCRRVPKRTDSAVRQMTPQTGSRSGLLALCKEGSLLLTISLASASDSRVVRFVLTDSDHRGQVRCQRYSCAPEVPYCGHVVAV